MTALDGARAADPNDEGQLHAARREFAEFRAAPANLIEDLMKQREGLRAVFGCVFLRGFGLGAAGELDLAEDARNRGFVGFVGLVRLSCGCGCGCVKSFQDPGARDGRRHHLS